MSPAYNETYIITLAFIDAFHEPAEVLAERMQLAYDGGNVAGFFQWQRLGRVTLLEFERQISEDTDVLADLGREMTPETVVKQLAYELREAREQPGMAQKEGLPAAASLLRDEAYNLVTKVADKLEAGGLDVKVEGLLCQMPQLRVIVGIAFPNRASRDVNVASMDEAMERLAERLGGTLVSYQSEKL